MLQSPPTSILILAALMASAGAVPTRALADPAEDCLSAAAAAAEETGVPYSVLLAIMLVETGRAGRPWPWTINLGGEGHWLDSLSDAENLAASALEAGATNIDLGCFQLNYYWHGAAFPSLTDMLDPAQNAAYAAAYLAEQHAKTGDWALAAAAYHSATPDLAAGYKARFEAAFAGLDPLALPAAEVSDPAARALNRFPLLVAGGPGRNGSLVPATPGGQRLIGGS